MFKSKTLMFSYLLVILGVLEVNLHLMQEALGPYYGATFVATAVVTAVLRTVTTKPLSDK